MIIKAAIKKGIVVHSAEPPKRHSNIIKTMAEDFSYDTPITGEQGFLDHNWDFLTRKEAAEEAYKCKQISKRVKYLFTEDLW